MLLVVAALEQCQGLGTGEFQVTAVRVLQDFGRDMSEEIVDSDTVIWWNYTVEKPFVFRTPIYDYNNPYDFLNSTGFHRNTGEHHLDGWIAC